MPVTLNPIAEKLKKLFRRSDPILREALRALNPEELAAVIDGLNKREQQRVLPLIGDEKLSLVLAHLSPHTSEVLIPKLTHEKVLVLMGFLESDDIADLIQALDKKKQDKIILALKKSDPKKVLPLLGFEEDTAGGLMKSEFLP